VIEPEPTTVNAVVDTAGARPRRHLGRWVALFALLLVGLTGVYLWTELERARSTAASGEAWRLEAESLSARLDALDRRIEQVSVGQRSVDGRIGEIVGGQRVIRQELLGIGERAATIEDAVARLSDQRLRGETTLKLNEIEALLVLAEQRLQLARDPAGARLALSLAASAVENIDDPLYAGLALPLRQERELLQNLPADPLPALRTTLADTLATLPELPRRLPRSSTDAADGSIGSRLQQALSGLVTVRKRAAADLELAGSARDAALEALRMDLRTALAAAETRDAAGVAVALQRLRPLFEALFDRQSQPVRQLGERLQQLDPSTLQQALPALGLSLSELRALRGSRQRLPPAAEIDIEPQIPLEPEAEPRIEAEPAPAAAAPALPASPASAPTAEPEPEPELPAVEPELELEPERAPEPETEPASERAAALEPTRPAIRA
jgi:uroporphyrin-3 C-methyltransferase